MNNSLFLKRMLCVAASQLAVLVFVLPVSAQEIVYDGMTYTVLDADAKTVELKSAYNASGDVNLPETITDAGQAYTVISIGSRAFSGSDITGITIPNSVTRINESAFNSCNALTWVDMPESVTEIGSRAFMSCEKLVSIDLPGSLTAISDYVFWSCSSLKSIDIPTSVTSIGKLAFNGSGLTSIKIPGAVASIGVEAFLFCSSMISIEVAEDNQFYCAVDGVLFDKAITTVFFCVPTKSGEYKLPNSVTTINSFAFGFCAELTAISLPAALTSVNDRAFQGCDKLSSINVDENNANFCSVDGVLFDKDMTTLIKYPSGRRGREYTVLSTVTSIGNRGFESCSALREIVISGSLTAIGNNAFYGCSKLSNIVLPSSLTTIGDNAFSFCSQLDNVVLPNSLVSIGKSAFSRCKNITRIVIPNSVTSLGESAFEGCYSLMDITIGHGVSRLLGLTFGDSWSGEEVVATTLHFNVVALDEYLGLNGNVEDIGLMPFGRRNLTTIYFGEEVQSLCSYAFSECDNTIKDIYCASTTPPTLGEECFKLTDKTTCVLHVPAGAKSAYESAYIWKDFLNIVDYVAGVDEVATDADADADVTVYDLSGIKVYEGQRDRMDLPTGIYIQVCGGKTTKVAIH